MLKCENVFHILLLNFMLCSVCFFVSGKRCTEVLSKLKTHEITVKEPCTVVTKARCGWISLSYCTYYDKTVCDKQVNETVRLYYVVSHCCQGFYQHSNGSCLQKLAGVVYTDPDVVRTTVDPHYVVEPVKQKIIPENKKPEISGGGYAGIICGLMLILSVTVFTLIAIRKRKRRKLEKSDHTMEVLYQGPTGGQSPVASLGTNQSSSPTRATPPQVLNFTTAPRERNPSSPSRETTPTKEMTSALKRGSTSSTPSRARTPSSPTREGTPCSLKREVSFQGEVTHISSNRGSISDSPTREVTPLISSQRETTPSSSRRESAENSPTREIISSSTRTVTPPPSPSEIKEVTVKTPLMAETELHIDDDIQESDV